jgi:DNA invertase Pin-like site-specific DNA recombinase
MFNLFTQTSLLRSQAAKAAWAKRPQAPTTTERKPARSISKDIQPDTGAESITLVEQAQLSVKATVRELGIHRSTFYPCGAAL